MVEGFPDGSGVEDDPLIGPVAKKVVVHVGVDGYIDIRLTGRGGKQLIEVGRVVGWEQGLTHIQVGQIMGNSKVQRAHLPSYPQRPRGKRIDQARCDVLSHILSQAPKVDVGRLLHVHLAPGSNDNQVIPVAPHHDSRCHFLDQRPDLIDTRARHQEVPNEPVFIHPLVKAILIHRLHGGQVAMHV